MCVGVGLEASRIMLVQSTQVLHRMHQCKEEKNLLQAHIHAKFTLPIQKKKNAGIKSEIAEILKYSLNHIHYHGEIDFMRQNCLLAGRIQVYYTVQNVWGQQFFFLFFKKLLMLTKPFI